MYVALEPAFPAAAVPISAPRPNAATRAGDVCEAFFGSEAGPCGPSNFGAFGALYVVVCQIPPGHSSAAFVCGSSYLVGAVGLHG